MDILVFFTDNGVPKTGLSPVIDIWELDGTHAVNNQNMTEIAGGFYKYNFSTYDDLRDYVIRADSVSLTGHERYSYSSNEHKEELDRILAVTELKKFTINDVSPTDKSFITDLTETGTSFWGRAVLLFLSGQNKGLIRKIQTYSGSTKKVTVKTKLPYVPANGDKLAIIPTRSFTVNIDDLPEMADAVWDETVSDHQSVGSFGEAITEVRGLIQSNFRIKDMVYGDSGNLVSATVRIYTNKTDATNDSSPLHEYSITSSIDANGAVNSFLSVKE
jgi:hypothetical protein